MNKNILKALAGAAVIALGMGSTAAEAATANAVARATILAPVTVTKTADLDFATIAVGTGAGTVAVSTGGVRTCGATLVCSGTATAAAFTIAGVTGQTVGVTVPANVTLSEAGGSTMTATLSGSAATYTLAAAASTLNVGGTLSVGATQVAGNYSGTFTVTVNYQ